jgi:hypothetical protein
MKVAKNTLKKALENLDFPLFGYIQLLNGVTALLFLKMQRARSYHRALGRFKS